MTWFREAGKACTCIFQQFRDLAMGAEEEGERKKTTHTLLSSRKTEALTSTGKKENVQGVDFVGCKFRLPDACC